MSHWRAEHVRDAAATLRSVVRGKAFSTTTIGRDHEELDVPGPYGTTRVYRWPGHGTPIVLLHGAQTSSLMWAPLIQHLHDAEIYAFDTPGDPGDSTQTTAMTTTDHLVHWLESLLETLRPDAVHLVGASYGGWVALHAAGRDPRRYRRLTLVEPVLDALRPRFFIHGITAGLITSVPGPQRFPLARRLDVKTLAEHPDQRRLGAMSFRSHKRSGLPRFTAVTDAVLGSLATPSLALLGARSPAHHAVDLARRLEHANPLIHAVVIPHAGHTLPVEQPDAVAHHLRNHSPQPTT